MQFYPALVMEVTRDRNFCIPKKSIEAREYVKFENIQVPIPAGSKEILEKIYGEAFKQIEEKGYAKRYAASTVPVHKVALVFSSSKKGLKGAKY